MGRQALIAFLSLIPALLFGQPFTVSELAWPTHGAAICGVFATNSAVTVDENTATPIQMLGGPSAGITYSILSGPTSGSLSSLNPTAGTVTYTPSLDFVGDDQFIFQVQSNSCTTNATVSITVSACTNISAANSLAVFAENQAGTIHLHGAGGAFSIVSSPTHGTLSSLDTSAGTVTYTPTTSFIGSDILTFQVQTNSCTTNGTVYINVFDSASTNATCSTVTDITSVDTEIVACSTTTVNGVSQGTVCTTNENSLGSPTSGTVCSALACDSIATNLFSFDVTATNYDNTNYASWTICNADSFSHTYQIVGTHSYSVPLPGGTVLLSVTTNGFVGEPGSSTVASISHFWPNPPGSNIQTTNTFTVAAHTFNLLVAVRVVVLETNTPATFSGAFTNSFQ